MNRIAAISVAVLAGLSATGTAYAQSTSEEGQWYLGPRLGSFGTDSDRVAIDNNQLRTFKGGFDSAFAGLEAGFQFTPEWGYRVYYDYLRGDLHNADSATGRVFGVDVLYNFTDNVYGSLGINNTELGDVSNRFLRAGAGYREQLNSNWQLFVEGAVQQNDGDLTEFMVMTGLRYYFGQSAAPAPAPTPAPEAAPVDSDGDGVMDANDRCPNTQPAYKVDSYGCVMYRNETVTHELRINFAFDSAVIPTGEKAEIQDTAEFLKEFPQLDIRIEGHTDSVGTVEYNQGLSERRAKSVGESLISDFGIEQERVSTIGFSENRPLVPNNSAENRAKNRRIEAQMSVTKEVPIKEDN
ncbi:Outer membrane porin F [Pseudidiomarina piscicola]|uniref:Outer membrane porin F n=1 Tax=Pseudidiomarina piscicola TaxID=2614830 RepID=A0A6S6WQ95_9GAMM|nr:OmpA family protein [Pseudidiomarina piscicola]CAB0151924.1 Outer membrane porin F [Pseudidiomarina piscicola]VZT41365.1 Outer membrane porin F [Pseudomonas aeruginosa]